MAAPKAKKAKSPAKATSAKPAAKAKEKPAAQAEEKLVAKPAAPPPAEPPAPEPPPPPPAPSTVDVSDETLEATPGRAVHLLRGIATIREVRAQLRKHGYGPEQHKQGWKLVQEASGFQGDDDTTLWDDKGTSDAISAIDTQDEDIYGLVGAMLRHRYPKQHAFLFQNLRAAKGMRAVLGMQMFLTRLTALEKGEATDDPKTDRAVFTALSARMIDRDKRKQLTAWVEKATSLHDDAESEAALASAKEREKVRKNALRTLRAWYEEWSEITRITIKRRDYLMRLGLAQYKRPDPDGDSDGPADAPGA